MKKKIKRMLFLLLIIFLLIVGYFFIGSTKPAQNIGWGVAFSQIQAERLGLDWQKVYLAILEELNVKKIKIATYWNIIEKEEGAYDFADLDWQIQKAEENNAEIIMVIGMKSPRWPECHLPVWAAGLSKEEQQKKISNLVKEIVLHYKDVEAIKFWQVENEPFFVFGECPWIDNAFLAEEVNLVKSLDDRNRPIIISDSGEGSLWFGAARLGDVVGTTMYKRVWMHQLKTYFNWPFPSVYYHRKAEIIRKFFGKEVICVELQAEPWSSKSLVDTPLLEQEKTMNLEQFKYNIKFAENTGLREFYLWGAEWWYWMKEQKGQDDIWTEAKKLFIK